MDSGQLQAVFAEAANRGDVIRNLTDNSQFLFVCLFYSFKSSINSSCQFELLWCLVDGGQ